ncbi:MAG: carboxypeptidase regulatory-like domain-containing protein, partial [Vicinamibacterales bacterium]
MSVLFFLTVFAPVPVHAQVATAATGTVSGTVTDSSGAVIADAEVILISSESGAVRTVMTARDGRYLFPGIPPGSYSVMVAKAGFRQAALRELNISVARSHVVDVTLEVGEVTETVEVVGGLAQVELQKTDASIGNVIENQRLMLLPSTNRDASSYFELQPGVAPRRSANSGGAVAGARSDQVTWMLDGMDVSDNNQGRLGGDLALAAPAIPVPSETVEEFRTTVSSPNATFGRAAGGQFTLVTKRGTNQWKGSAYEYHQNDALNANTWDRNRRGEAKPQLRDNRFGMTLGGPVQRDRSFFFFGYEGRRFPRSEEFSRIVPTDSLRNGILRFRDASGNVVDYDLAQSLQCGIVGGQPCDPRRLGISPVVRELFNAVPAGNDSSLGDGLNTTGFRDVVPTDLNSNYFVLRLDHTLNSNWRLESRFSYAWSEIGLSTPLDLRGGPGNVVSQGSRPDRLRSGLAALVGQISPRLLNEFRFGWTKPLWKEQRPSPVPLVSGTNIALDFARMDEPVDQFPRNRFQFFDEETFQFINNLTWLKGAHTIQTGGSARQIQFINTRGDKFAAFNAIVGQLRGGPFFTVSPANRPPTCSAQLTTNCLRPGDVTTWGDFYAGTLGIVDSIAGMAVRDGDLNNLPLGTPLQNDASQFAYELYFNDTWQLRPTLTLGYGLLYSWQTPVVEKLGRQTILVNNDTCNPADLTSCPPISPQAFLEARREAASAG